MKVELYASIIEIWDARIKIECLLSLILSQVYVEDKQKMLITNDKYQ